MKRYFFAILGILLSTALLLGVLETTAHWIVYWRYGYAGKSYGIFMQDPELGFIHRPNSYNSLTSLNNYALRNREDVMDPKPSHSLRILAVGGSTTFGYNLANEDTFTEQLEKRLRAVPGHEKDQVLNAGTIAYSANHNLIRLKRLLPKLYPDYVLIYEGINENTNEYELLKQGVTLDAKEKKFGLVNKDFLQARWLWTHSVLLKWLDYRVKTSRDIPAAVKASLPKTSDRPDVNAWEIENFKWALHEMITACRAQHARPIVIRYATVRTALEYRYFSDLAAATARQEGVPVCDMEGVFERTGNRMDSLFIHTGVHVTSEGAALLANELFEIILQDQKNHA